jgi:hypothetical protein
MIWQAPLLEGVVAERALSGTEIPGGSNASRAFATWLSRIVCRIYRIWYPSLIPGTRI